MKITTMAAAAALSTAVVGLSATSAQAAPDGPISSKTFAAVSEVPCDGVIYPVLTSQQPYTSPAGSAVRLVKGASQTLTVADATATIDHVTSGWTVGGEISLSWAPKWGDVKTGTAGGKVSGSYSRTHVQGTTVTFTQTSAITLTPRVDDVVATPVYFKMQAWGDYYRCDVGGSSATRLTSNEVFIDIADASGWLLTCGDEACVAGEDY